MSDLHVPPAGDGAEDEPAVASGSQPAINTTRIDGDTIDEGDDEAAAPARTPSTPLSDKRVVVLKVGSSTLVNPKTGHVAISNIGAIVETICELKSMGFAVVLVSSGSIALGMRQQGLDVKPRKLATKQALAAIGQAKLMRVYEDLFGQLAQPIAQILLTRQDLAQRSRYLNAQNTFRELLAMDVVPIVNENDTVSVAEIRFGDNDTLSALVAGIVEAQWLFILTDVEFLYDRNPRVDPDAQPLKVVEDLRELSVSTAGGAGSNFGTGGMASKLTAAALSTSVGCNTSIVLGTEPERIIQIIEGSEDAGTVFLATARVHKDRKWWIRHSLYVAGQLVVDAGAVRALKKHNSLFAAGVRAISGGPWVAQNCVEIVTEDGTVVARGLVNYSSQEVERIRGCKSADIADILGYADDESVVHRGNIALLLDP